MNTWLQRRWSVERAPSSPRTSGSRHFLLPEGLVIALQTLVDFVLEAAIRHAGVYPATKYRRPSVTIQSPGVVWAGFDLPRAMPAPS
jgi:hypothetical protein